MSELILNVQAEEDAANAVHRSRSRLHQLLWTTGGLGYCLWCMPIALAAVDAATDDNGELRAIRLAPPRQETP